MSRPITEDIFYFVASIIGISSFFLTDILLLRSLYLVASTLFIISGIIFHINIMIIMNAFYFIVNAFQIIRLLLERTTILLPEELKAAYNQVFSNMKPKEFLAFIKLGVNKISEKDTFLCREHDTQDVLWFILQGRASVEKNTKQLIGLSNNFFIGEMRFLTQKPMSADVRTQSIVRYIEWEHKSLAKLQIKKPDVYMKFLAALAKDLIHKLQKQTYHELV